MRKRVVRSPVGKPAPAPYSSASGPSGAKRGAGATAAAPPPPTPLSVAGAAHPARMRGRMQAVTNRRGTRAPVMAGGLLALFGTQRRLGGGRENESSRGGAPGARARGLPRAGRGGAPGGS